MQFLTRGSEILYTRTALLELCMLTYSLKVPSVINGFFKRLIITAHPKIDLDNTLLLVIEYT